MMSKVIHIELDNCEACPYSSYTAKFCDHPDVGEFLDIEDVIPSRCPLVDKVDIALVDTKCQCDYICYPRCTNPERHLMTPMGYRYWVVYDDAPNTLVGVFNDYDQAVSAMNRVDRGSR